MTNKPKPPFGIEPISAFKAPDGTLFEDLKTASAYCREQAQVKVIEDFLTENVSKLSDDSILNLNSLAKIMYENRLELIRLLQLKVGEKPYTEEDGDD